TPPCGKTCIDLYSRLFGSMHVLPHGGVAALAVIAPVAAVAPASASVPAAAKNLVLNDITDGPPQGTQAVPRVRLVSRVALANALTGPGAAVPIARNKDALHPRLVVMSVLLP